MNVTVVCEGFARDSFRLQPWRRVYEICRKLLKNKNSVTIVSDQKNGDLSTEEIDGLRVIRIKHLMMAPILNRKLLKATILKSTPDVVIWYGSSLSAVYLPRLNFVGKPLIWDMDSEIHTLRILSRVSFREIIHPHHNFLWEQIITGLLPRLIIKSVANSSLICKVVVPSHFLKSSLCNIGVDPGKIAVVPSTIDEVGSNWSCTDEETKKAKAHLGLSTEGLVVAYFGSPCTLRGVDTAIISMTKILTQRKDVKLMILSRRPILESKEGFRILKTEEEALAKIVGKKRLEDYVKIIPGILDRNTLESYLRASDVVVLPFKLVFSEPPLSVFEAMKMGKLVITSRIGTLSEIVGKDRGMLVEPNRPEELAQTILSVSDHPIESAFVRKKAEQYVANLPTWDAVTDEFSQMLKAIIQDAE